MTLEDKYMLAIAGLARWTGICKCLLATKAGSDLVAKAMEEVDTHPTALVQERMQLIDSTIERLAGKGRDLDSASDD